MNLVIISRAMAKSLYCSRLVVDSYHMVRATFSFTTGLWRCLYSHSWHHKPASISKVVGGRWLVVGGWCIIEYRVSVIAYFAHRRERSKRG